MNITWNPSLESLADNVRGLKELIAKGMDNRGNYWSVELEGEAKQTAPWTDQTGNARKGLTGRYEVQGNSLTIYLFHTVEYGPFLEMGTGKMRPFPVILPTMQRNYGKIMKDFSKIFGG